MELKGNTAFADFQTGLQLLRKEIRLLGQQQASQQQLVILIVPIKDSIFEKLNGKCPPELMPTIMEAFSRRALSASDTFGPTLDKFLQGSARPSSSKRRVVVDIEEFQPVTSPNFVLRRSVGRVEEVSDVERSQGAVRRGSFHASASQASTSRIP
jgi:hypothetical protein